MKKEYDVHFSLNGYYRITASSPEEAEQIAEEILNPRMSEVEETVRTAMGVEIYETTESETA